MCDWIHQSKRRRRAIKLLTQPLTVKQLAFRMTTSLGNCSKVLVECSREAVVRCLNARANTSRVYWMTALGRSCRSWMYGREEALPAEEQIAATDWELYGWVNHRHRSAIIETMSRPLRPSELKRKARLEHEALRMSANNVRDVMRLFVKRGVVRKTWPAKSTHPSYELTETGRRFRELLMAARMNGWGRQF